MTHPHTHTPCPQAEPDLERQRAKERLDDRLRTDAGSKREKPKVLPVKRPRRDRDTVPLTEFSDAGIPQDGGRLHRLKANYLAKIVRSVERLGCI